MNLVKFSAFDLGQAEALTDMAQQTLRQTVAALPNEFKDEVVAMGRRMIEIREAIMHEFHRRSF